MPWGKYFVVSWHQRKRGVYAEGNPKGNMARNAVQVVLLGSGLDTRAWRLNFPSGTAVFEVDQLDMKNFKLQCLRNSLAQTDAASDSAPFNTP